MEIEPESEEISATEKDKIDIYQQKWEKYIIAFL